MVGLPGGAMAVLLSIGAQAAPPSRGDQAAAVKPHPPTPIGGVAQWFGADAYPADALRANEEGRVVARVTVDPAGKPVDCAVATSSGSFALDKGTCDIAMTNMTFRPALATDGRAVEASFPLAVRWVMPKSVTPSAASDPGGRGAEPITPVSR